MSTQRGQQGEQRACRYLQAHGYHILCRNVRLGAGEIDIIAEQGELLAFVEVKSYRQREQAIAAVHADKRRRLIQAATIWLAANPQAAQRPCRFDVLIIYGQGSWLRRPTVEYITDAFRP